MYGIFSILWVYHVLPLVTSVSIFRHLHYADVSDMQVPVDGVCRSPRPSRCDVGFSYNRIICRGPSTWSTISTCFRSCNNGRIQSPINIVSRRTQYVPNLPNLVLRPEHRNLKVLAGNNHNHAPNFVSEQSVGPDLVLRHPLLEAGVFRFHEIHVHIGRDPRYGSENSVNGVHTPMEAHMVFYNRLKGETFENASKQENGLLVIGVFLEVPKNRLMDLKYFGHRPSNRACKAILRGRYTRGTPSGMGHRMRKLHPSKTFLHPKIRAMTLSKKTRISKLSRRRNKRSSVRIDKSTHGRKMFKHKKKGRCLRRKARRLSQTLECAYRSREVRKFAEPQTPPGLDVLFSPSEALPVVRDYYAYKGSLTTPPCTQNVQWIVMRCSVVVSNRVLSALQRVQGYRDGRTLQFYGVRRPTQTNRNVVYRNFIS